MAIFYTNGFESGNLGSIYPVTTADPPMEVYGRIGFPEQFPPPQKGNYAAYGGGCLNVSTWLSDNPFTIYVKFDVAGRNFMCLSAFNYVEYDMFVVEAGPFSYYPTHSSPDTGNIGGVIKYPFYETYFPSPMPVDWEDYEYGPVYGTQQLLDNQWNTVEFFMSTSTYTGSPETELVLNPDASIVCTVNGITDVNLSDRYAWGFWVDTLYFYGMFDNIVLGTERSDMGYGKTYSIGFDPSSTGAYTEWEPTEEGSPNYQMVTGPGDTTSVDAEGVTTRLTDKIDTYGTTQQSGSGTFTHIKSLNIMLRGVSLQDVGRVYPVIYFRSTPTVATEYIELATVGEYKNVTAIWVTRPNSGGPWQIEDLDTVQIGALSGSDEL